MESAFKVFKNQCKDVLSDCTRAHTCAESGGRARTAAGGQTAVAVPLLAAPRRLPRPSGRRRCLCRQILLPFVLQLPRGQRGLPATRVDADGAGSLRGRLDPPEERRGDRPLQTPLSFHCFLCFPLGKGFVFYYGFESLSHISRHFKGFHHLLKSTWSKCQLSVPVRLHIQIGRLLRAVPRLPHDIARPFSVGMLSACRLSYHKRARRVSFKSI